jgi:hypothetical protein
MGNTSDPRVQEADLAEPLVRHQHHCECHNIRNGVPDPEPVFPVQDLNIPVPLPATHSHSGEINANIIKINNLNALIASGPADHQIQLARDYMAYMALINSTPKFGANISQEDQKFFTYCFCWKGQQRVVNSLTEELDQTVSMLGTATEEMIEASGSQLVEYMANIRHVEGQRAFLGCTAVDAQIRMYLEEAEAHSYKLWYRGAYARYLKMRVPQLKQRLENQEKELGILLKKMEYAGGAPFGPGDDIPRPARPSSAPPLL